MNRWTIPDNISAKTIGEMVKLYHGGFGWVIHPVERPAKGGKKPLTKGWKKLEPSFLTEELAKEFFHCDPPYNIGCVIRPPHVVIDLDSKQDDGESVLEWLNSQPELTSIPRERTGGGVHIHVRCDDLPAFRKAGGKPYEKALVASLNDQVTAELYFDSLNLVLSPSAHENGRTYRWEVFGDIPTVTWLELQKWFGFENPAGNKVVPKRKPGRPRKEAEWWEHYKGDLKTLRLAELFGKLRLKGNLLNADEDKWSVNCPWHKEHSDGGTGWNPNKSSTVIWNKKGEFPMFKCLHAHCEGKELKEVLEFGKTHGLDVDALCERQRTWVPGQVTEDGRPRIILPGGGKTDSQFAGEVGEQIKANKVWFNHNHRTVIIRPVEITEELTSVGFHALKPIETGTHLEQLVETGFLGQDNFGNKVFEPASLNREWGDKLLHAPQLLSRLPKILRILDGPLPVLHDGGIHLPRPGYNPTLKAYLLPSAPEIKTMPVNEARQLIHETLEDFCFESEQAAIHAVSRLLTPFCKGLMGWKARSPLWVYEANRERCGKDYLNGVVQIVHDGNIVSNPPFNSDEELRKKITAALRSGTRRMHFANMKGHISSGALEEAVTNQAWSDRTLGQSEEKKYANEIEFSLSCNVGTTWTPDLGNRMRIISLFLAQEDPNERNFKRPDLHGWIRERRGDILSALWAFVKLWDESGRPDGKTLFASFPEWAKTVGGIMHTGDLGDPCLPDKRTTKDGGDEMTGDMRELFALAHEEFGDEWASKSRIYQLLEDRSDLGLFSWFDLHDKSGKTKFGKALHRYDKRVLGEVVLAIEGNKNSRRYKFLRPGDAPESPLVTLSFLSGEGTSGTSPAVNSTDLSKPVAEPAAQATPLLVKEEHKAHKEPVPPCETWGNNYKGLLEGGHISNYLIPRKEGEEGVPESPYVPLRGDARLITERSELGKIAEAVSNAGSPVALGIKTCDNGSNPWRGDIRLLCLGIPDHPAWLLDLRAIGYDLGELGHCLQERQVIAHNAKFDLLWLRHKCGLQLDSVFCTLTASRLLTNGRGESKNDLYTCWERFLGLPPGTDQGKSDWGGMVMTEDQLEYAALDVLHLHRLRDKQLEAIATEQLESVLDLENRLVPVVAKMENNGFRINRDRLVGLMEDYAAELEEASAVLREELGNNINPNSPKQLKEALNKKGLGLANTSERTLKQSGHSLASCILDYRSAKKQMEQAETILKATETDGRIHARFEPTGTNTGRFSSKKPNLQNIGRGKLRTCFVPGDSNRLVVADYSQVELRIAAAIAGEERMVQAYEQGCDLHRQTASIVLGKPVEDVSKEDRQLAKAVNFGLLYGQSAKGLVGYAKKKYGVEMEYERAYEIRGKFFSAYTGLREWHKSARKMAAQGVQSVRTVLGRVRRLPKGEAAEWERFTALVNTPAQGGSADALKQAMVTLSGQLPPEAGIVSTVHDELIIEVPLKNAEAVKKLMEEVMIESAASLYPTVPFEVEAHICKDWSEK